MPGESLTHRMLRDPVFITGAYFVIAILEFFAIAICTMVGEKAGPNGIAPDLVIDSWIIAGDVLYVLAINTTLVAAALIASIPGWMILVSCLSSTLFVADLYTRFGAATGEAENLLICYDYWSMFAVSGMLIAALLGKKQSHRASLVIVGWMVFIFGNILLYGVLGSIGKENLTPSEPRLIPLLAALIFWIPALWSGSRQSSSQQ